MSNSSPVRLLPKNTSGKDYVVGDLHGCFELLERLLKQVEFNSATDRLFSVGDLIDRGPDSLRCLQLLEQPWFYAVQGNHENMLLNFFVDYLLNGKLEGFTKSDLNELATFGAEWIKHYYQADHQRMTPEFDYCLHLLSDLPLIWIVGDDRERFHVIHAELLRPQYKGYGQPVWLDSDIDRWLAEEMIPADSRDRLSWGRMLMDSNTFKHKPNQEGLSMTFCGHTYETHLRQVLSHLCLDTGAFITHPFHSDNEYEEDDDYGLTLFNVKEANWVRASYKNPDVILSGIWPDCRQLLNIIPLTKLSM